MKDLTQSLEKYLLAVNKIVQKNSAGRVKDIAKELNIGMASTSEAIKTLAKKGYINYVPYGIITITKKGEDAVELKTKRHEIICKFLSKCLITPIEIHTCGHVSISNTFLTKFSNSL